MKFKCSLVPIFKGDFVLYVCAIFTKKKEHKNESLIILLSINDLKNVMGKKLETKKKIRKHSAPTQ